MKILIVDDSITARKIIARALFSLGVKHMLEAKDGKEGLHILGKVPDIDIIIVDWEMTVMDGITFIKEVRNNPAFVQTKIIMATSKHTKEDVVTALRAGADNYIAKPFSDATLTTRLKPMIDALLPAQNTERFIRSFVNRPLKNLAIEEETLLLDFGSKRIKIDIPLMIYHGALQVEEDEEVFHPITAES